MTRASRSDITRRRLVSQALTGAITDPAAVVDRMLALQAQDLRWAKWAVAVRAPGSTSADIDALIDSGRVVRSWPMRGTLHLVPAPDLAWLLDLSTPRLWAGAATMPTKAVKTTSDMTLGFSSARKSPAVASDMRKPESSSLASSTRAMRRQSIFRLAGTAGGKPAASWRCRDYLIFGSCSHWW